MTKEIAREIADKFIKEHNPNLWDGLGNMPSNFSNKIEVYNIFSKEVYMTIQFEIDADEGGCWAHIVKLYSNKDGCNDELIDGYFGNGINLADSLAETIVDLCDDYKEFYE